MVRVLCVCRCCVLLTFSVVVIVCAVLQMLRVLFTFCCLLSDASVADAVQLYADAVGNIAVKFVALYADAVCCSCCCCIC